MRTILNLFITSAILFCTASGAWAVTAVDLVSQGDRAMTANDYRSAATIYAKAMNIDSDNPTILEKLEQAIVLKKADGLLSMIDREVQKKGDLRISAKHLIALMMAGEKVTMIDIRTPQERVFTIPTKAIAIQIPDIIKNLAAIPHDGTVVIICHSSPRAMIVTTALRIAGYDNVYALKGGIMSLANINAKKAPDDIR